MTWLVEDEIVFTVEWRNGVYRIHVSHGDRQDRKWLKAVANVLARRYEKRAR